MTLSAIAIDLINFKNILDYKYVLFVDCLQWTNLLNFTHDN